MVYHLPELDRMSRALSRLETALLTQRSPTTSVSAFEGSNNDTIQKNQTLRLQCQEMREQLQQAHLLLGELLGGGASKQQEIEAPYQQITNINDEANDG